MAKNFIYEFEHAAAEMLRIKEMLNEFIETEEVKKLVVHPQIIALICAADFLHTNFVRLASYLNELE